MRQHRQELLRSAIRQLQRGRKTTGGSWLPPSVSASPTSFDLESGDLRRTPLQHAVRGFFGQSNDALAPDVDDPAVMPSVLRSHPDSGSRPVTKSVGAAR